MYPAAYFASNSLKAILADMYVIGIVERTSRAKVIQAPASQICNPTIDSFPPPGPRMSLLTTSRTIIVMFKASFGHWKFVLSASMIFSSSADFPLSDVGADYAGVAVIVSDISLMSF